MLRGSRRRLLKFKGKLISTASSKLAMTTKQDKSQRGMRMHCSSSGLASVPAGDKQRDLGVMSQEAEAGGLP